MEKEKITRQINKLYNKEDEEILKIEKELNRLTNKLFSLLQPEKDSISGNSIVKIENDYIYTTCNCYHKSWLKTMKIY